MRQAREQPVGSDRAGEDPYCYLKWASFEPCPREKKIRDDFGKEVAWKAKEDWLY